MTILHPSVNSASGKHRQSFASPQRHRATIIVGDLDKGRLSLATALALNVVTGALGLDDDQVTAELKALLPALTPDVRRRRMELVVELTSQLAAADPTNLGLTQQLRTDLSRALTELFRGSQWSRANRRTVTA